ncbi:uncharacterized protein [Diadema antillarum]|uniref:uncharacterized protein n=1 Tax=Diadema antillarum TaxID=105358 RepID=UPI003A863C14
MIRTYVEGFHDEEAVSRMRYSPLGNTGMDVSAVGFGASPLGFPYYGTEGPSAERCRATVEKALCSGINYIDTAPWYGQGKSEERLGVALKGIPRESYFIATKVGRYETNVEKMFDFTAERTARSVDESLARLGLDCVDIIQAHDVEFAPSLEVVLEETLPALARARDAGKARFIGITGYPISTLREIVERSKVKIDTVLSYCHLDLNDSSLLQHISFFKERGIGLISASPLSMGLLTPQGPPAWHPASDEVKETCLAASSYCREHSVDFAKLALHYAFSHRDVSTVLVGLDRPEYVESNLNVAHNKLSDTEEKALVHIQERYFPSGVSRSWEGTEVNRYWQKLKARRAQQPGEPGGETS